MATPLGVNNIVKCTIVCEYGGQASLNSFYYLVTSVGAVAATDQDAADVFAGVVDSLVPPLLYSSANYNGVMAQIIYPLPIIFSKFNTGGAAMGSGGSTAVGGQVCGINSWQLLVAKRGNFGRTYWPFPPCPLTTTPLKPSTSYTTNLGTICAAILGIGNFSAGGRVAGVEQIILHRANPVLSQPVLNFTVHDRWATQKRRGSYGRANVSPI